jgi:tetratricopeptide (TPR) repeat protein
MQVWELTRELGQFPNPWSFNFYAKAAIHLGHYDEAKAVSIESLELAKQKGHFSEVGWAAMHLSMIALSQGDLIAAEQYLLESASVLADMGHMHTSLPQAVLSYVLRAQGDSRLARDHLTSALRSGVEHRSILALMKCLPIAALLAADDGNSRKAIELYGLAQQFGYITNSRWFKDIACRELDEARASLPVDVAAAAETRGRHLDVWQTAVALLDELTNQ